MDDCDGDGDGGGGVFVNPCSESTPALVDVEGNRFCVSDARGDSCVRDEARRQFLAQPIS
eukprot:scaffold276810_cov46-Attheya_sp.AAC.1